MTSYRGFPSTSGPGSAVTYSGSFLSAVAFAVKGGGCWFEGYWYWCASNASTTAPKCALWSVTSGGTGAVVPGSVITPSATLTAGAWNYLPLPTPVQLAPGYDPNSSANGSAYIAAVGVNSNFSDTNSMFNSGDVYAAGIVNGPLVIYSGTTGSNKAPYGLGNGLFTTGGSDPATTMPNGVDSGGDGGSNFWVDVQVRDSPPPGYGGSYRIWPNKSDANSSTTTDTTTGDVIATEVHLTQPCTLNKVWYYSHSSAGELGNWAGVYLITGANSGTLVAQNASPSWSGAAASGWVSCSMPAGITLAPGSYKVAVGGAGPTLWGPKDASTDYWRSGVGSNGITNGPLLATKLSASSTAYTYNGNAGGTPPYSDGTTQVGQPTFAIGAGPAYPYLFAPVTTPTAGSTQNYWIDLEVTPVPVPLNSADIQPSRTWTRQYRRFAETMPAPPTAAGATIQGTASLAGGGTVSAVVTQIAPATVTGAGAASAVVTQGAGASPAGAGSVSALVTEIAPAAMTGAGSLSSAVTQAAGASPSGAGSLSAVVTQGVIASPAGAGALSAAVTQQATAAPAGAGSLSALAVQQAIAALAGAGVVNANSGGNQTGTASIAGAGALSAAGIVIVAGTASLAGAGSLAAPVTLAAGASPAGAGTVAALAAQLAGAALAGAGTVTASGTAQGPFTVGRLTASTQSGINTAATQSGINTTTTS